ncbi:molybdenum cofactor sulfurase (plasmid) [Burkholderia sp. SFA1]|uniref:MOSC domain-containing protein n=1 Tax=unclassified Caballeronia TaxID=2646786 RepID=UPI001F352C7C|nr:MULTISPECIES: MOSC domain-containing protein [unclassified Caballeronia]MCE4546554.1 MOSC domain-containing protein [Caballeronia sp. PC1]MCE4572973.1 MOSC domain-containing protein [Caballeronia sp. CLC5]BBQ01651.1 molybdenum cofactor sulfurase [Burkholderia sp. SFA1]
MPLNPDSPLARLMNAPVKPGRVIWIGLRVSRRAPLQVVESALALAGAGLDGDHYSRKEGSRQVTLIQAESLRAIASHLGLDEVSPGGLRRNIVTSGINLNALKDRRFRIGDAVLEASGECHPCSRMEETFGVGGYNAVRGFGGITARVIEGGTIALANAIVPC